MERSRLAVFLVAGFCAITQCHIRTYHYVTTPMNWNKAQSYCREKYTDLATVDNQTVQDKMMSSTEGVSSGTWIGLYHGPENWQWVSGERISYVNWKANLFCAALDSQGFWKDLTCYEHLPFMCYTETSDVTQRYTLNTESKNWATARDYCREKHTDLVTISNHSENEAMRERAGGGTVWIGLFNEPWKWSSGEVSSFRNWNTNDPNNFYDNEKCVRLSYGQKWLDSSCSITYPFFCQEDIRELILVRQNKTWEEALDHCRSRYTDLTSIVSVKEQNLTALKARNAQTPHVWLGLRQSFITRSWFWVNREAMGYKKWLQGGQPQCPQSSYCGAMSIKSEDYAWTDLPCKERLNFICYRA